MTDQTDRVLDLIDGALDDYTSPDAMRWSPDPENAEPAQLPPPLLPGQDIRIQRGGIRYPATGVRVTPLDEHGHPTADGVPITAVDVRSTRDEAIDRLSVGLDVPREILDPYPNIIGAIRRGIDEYRDRYRLGVGEVVAAEHRRMLDTGQIQVVRHRTIETNDDGALLQADARTPDGRVHGQSTLLDSWNRTFPELVDHTWQQIDERLAEQLRGWGFAEFGILVVPEDVALGPGADADE